MKKWAIAWLLVCFMMVTAAPMAAAADQVDVNKASVEELIQLQKVGPKIAEAIIAYRNANGPFKALEDLKNVKGVGDKIIELNKDRIILGKK